MIKVTKEPLINASIAEIDISIERKNLQLLYLGRSCKQSAFLVHPVNIREDQEEILVNVGSDSPPHAPQPCTAPSTAAPRSATTRPTSRVQGEGSLWLLRAVIAAACYLVPARLKNFSKENGEQRYLGWAGVKRGSG